MSVVKFALAGAAAAIAYVAIPRQTTVAGDLLAEPAPTAISRLELKERVVEGTGMGSLRIAGAGIKQGAVMIRVQRAGAPRAAKCSVLIAAVDEHQSRAAVDCSQPNVQGRPIARVAVQALEIVVREHVAATVARRQYDTDAVADRMIALVTVNRALLAAAAL